MQFDDLLLFFGLEKRSSHFPPIEGAAFDLLKTPSPSIVFSSWLKVRLTTLLDRCNQEVSESVLRVVIIDMFWVARFDG